MVGSIRIELMSLRSENPTPYHLAKTPLLPVAIRRANHCRVRHTLSASPQNPLQGTCSVLPYLVVSENFAISTVSMSPRNSTSELGDYWDDLAERDSEYHL